ncbi:DUF6868 family protein [Glaciecola sp. MF2-115]|uniref:DUF6868 family protein n=1 Tax=Glaciecola sp. MF2-115 TaxID=3384827 RepID=UPI00399F6D00
MITLSELTELLGWASVINIAYLLFVTIMLVIMGGTITSIHSKIFKIDEKKLKVKYFDFLSNYKVMSIIFTLVPYLSLKIMGF